MGTAVHEFYFEGDNWDYVLQKRRGNVEEALAAETARALQCERGDVSDVVLDAKADTLVAFVTVRHLDTLGEDQIGDALAAHAYKELWDLYEPRSLVGGRMSTTTLTPRCEGFVRGRVVKKRCASGAEALTPDAARGAQSGVADRSYVVSDGTPDSRVAFVTVEHSDMSVNVSVERQPAEGEMGELWDHTWFRHVLVVRGRGRSDEAWRRDRLLRRRV
ncbi:putative microtubule-associated protein Gb4 [Trypanosoma grayi]|uniref:putative microtubule-associated protein Gb4 n=1 Tax=Trypanosoma grayi TaxID=71804 RepID=UPI0004F49071|nr:putative microtubule-associated protein Gb4 [Trypanosoma grayi]KEG07980.1 putative microtubule-associated protein Gb4 [Trypanosoma grayi]